MDLAYSNIAIKACSNIAIKGSYMESQEDCLGSKKMKPPTLILPNLMGKAIQEFLDSTEPVTCDETITVLHKKKKFSLRIQSPPTWHEAKRICRRPSVRLCALRNKC